jgi:Cd2+/Zn2+-exporting ATPase
MAGARCTLEVQGLDCPTEVAALRAALDGAAGVGELGFDLIVGTMTVAYDPDAVSSQAIVRRVVERSGLKARLLAAEPVVEATPWLVRHRAHVLTAVAGVALLAGVVGGLVGAPAVAARVAFGVAVAAGLVGLAPKALRALRSRRLDMHVLMTLAILGAVALGQLDEAATVAFLFGLSEALESLSLDRARRAVRRLLDITPETAERIAPGGGATEVVPARDLRVGDRVRVRAGDRLPIDGRVIAGRSSVDQKAITGESVAVARGPGDAVYAGTVNGEGSLDVEATAAPGDSVAARIAGQVRAAQAGRSPTERTVERFAAVYTPAVVALAALVMVGPPLVGLGPWRDWFARGLILLVVSCPCALVISTPVAVVSALASAARRGVLIKGGAYLEAVGRLRALAFDKTGTLTRGEPAVVEVHPAPGRDPRELLRVAAAVGDRGGHVLGRAIARHARGLDVEVPEARDYTAVPGLGASALVDSTRYHVGSHRYLDEAGLCRGGGAFHEVLHEAESRGGTSVALTEPRGPLGWIRLADRPRPESAGVVRELADLGVRAVMLTGDNAATAGATARELGIGEFRAALLPADKAGAIAELDAAHGPTGMVGDGVNDAPALAAARVSVALGGVSSGLALETADIVLMADDLAALPWLVRHARRATRMIRQNIAIAVGSKLVVVALAVAGLATMWMAIAADVGVSLLVVANALRLLRAR